MWLKKVAAIVSIQFIFNFKNVSFFVFLLCHGFVFTVNKNTLYLWNVLCTTKATNSPMRPGWNYTSMTPKDMNWKCTSCFLLMCSSASKSSKIAPLVRRKQTCEGVPAGIYSSCSVVSLYLYHSLHQPECGRSFCPALLWLREAWECGPNYRGSVNEQSN